MAGGFDTGPPGSRRLGLGGASAAYNQQHCGLDMNPGLRSQWADSLKRLIFGGIGQVRRASLIGQDDHRRTDQALTASPGGQFCVA